MNQKKIALFRRGDLALIVILLLLSACLFLYFSTQSLSGGDLEASITVDGKLYRTLKLNEIMEPQEIRIGDPVFAVIRAEKGRIRFLEADCPDKICVNTGWLTGNRQSAACIPLKILITLTSRAPGHDALTGSICKGMFMGKVFRGR